MATLKRLVIISAICFWGSLSFAQTSAEQPRIRQALTLTIASAVAINTAQNFEVRSITASPEVLGVEGFNLVTFEITYTRSAGTGVQFYLESCNEGLAATNCTDAADWHRVQSISIAAGTGTLTDLLVTKVMGATAYYTYSIAINYRRFRIASMTATGAPNANDKATVKARLSANPAF